MIKILNLKNRREEANLSQEELCIRINSIAQESVVTQSTISKYEANPDNIPAQLAHIWAKALGLSTIFEEEAKDPKHIMVDPGKPYEDLERHLTLVEDYVGLCPREVEEHTEGDFTVYRLREMLKDLKGRRKPNLAFLGEYDVGKSHLVNRLLGSECLPTSYQPMTRIPFLLIHTEDRPASLGSEVYLLSRGFEPQRAHEEEHVTNCTILAGGLNLLRDYGSHKGVRKDDKEVDFALVYLDAPLLQACNVIDAPGYQGQRADEEKVNRLSASIDILCYLSMAKGFMKAQDIQRFAHLLCRTKSYEDGSFRRLGNIMLVASQADPSIREESLSGPDGIMTTAADRIMEYVPDAIKSQAQRYGDITKDDLRQCIFPFWAEDENRFKGLRNNIHGVVSRLIPPKYREYVDKTISEFKIATHSSLATTIEMCQSRIKDFERMKAHYEMMVEKEPERLKGVADSRKLIEHNIDLYKRETTNEIGSIYRELINEDSLERFINSEFYKEKKKAKEYAVVRLLDKLKADITKIAQTRADQLSELIEDFVKGYEAKAMALYPQETTKGRAFSIPFDMKGAFVGGLAAAGTFGALAAWVSTLGNLGGFILVAKAAGIAAALGIPVGSGGAAAWIAAVAVIGGPITIGVGLALLTGAVAWAIFGDSWQTRLAKKIISSFKEEKVLDGFQEWGRKYWSDALKAFGSGAEAIEKEYQKKLRELKDLVENISAGNLETRIQELKAVESFFANIPWRFTS